MNDSILAQHLRAIKFVAFAIQSADRSECCHAPIDTTYVDDPLCTLCGQACLTRAEANTNS
ncbi:MAG: hypothetical protein QM775_30850 [Pirellulales bacterium]